MIATYTHHLAGAAEGQRVERHGLEVRLLAKDGFIMRSVHCGNDEDARSACIWMADDAYREAESAETKHTQTGGGGMSPEQKKDGGPAFPVSEENYLSNGTYRNPGMTLRDYFATHAMFMGFDWVNVHQTGGYAEAAIVAYEIADAMLAAREGRS